jgi:3'-phosphoadenosine 5'-phosphosulfate sulfotransferase (PAPS reductase)/FAD synthetase
MSSGKNKPRFLLLSNKLTSISYPKCYALVSGGKDSLSTAQVLHEAGKLEACVAIETGVSTPDWKEFVVKTCELRKWPLEFYKTTESYETFVHKYGFPGPSKHSWIMQKLKGRGVQQFRKTHPTGVLASGVRQDESIKRAASVRPVGVWEGVPILAPIYDWSTEATWKFFHDRGFERAPGYSTLQISGDCLCGAYAREGEDEALRYWYPEIADRFDNLSHEIKDKHPTRCKWGWGCKSPIKKKTVGEQFVCVECAPRDLDLDLVA